MQQSDYDVQDPQRLIDDEKKTRIAYAKKMYCHLARDHGIDVCSWKGFSAWVDYVEGNIGETELAARAETELKEFLADYERRSKVIAEMPPPMSAGTPGSPDPVRVKRANRIYSILCRNSGISACFFRDFGSWSSYVEGAIDEEIFIETAQHEIKKLRNGYSA